jgi:hypothetical protein
VTAVPVGPVWNDLVDLVGVTSPEAEHNPGDAFDHNDTGAFDPRDLDDY